jgi:hypothetical protein
MEHTKRSSFDKDLRAHLASRARHAPKKQTNYEQKYYKYSKYEEKRRKNGYPEWSDFSFNGAEFTSDGPRKPATSNDTSTPPQASNRPELTPSLVDFQYHEQFSIQPILKTHEHKIKEVVDFLDLNLTYLSDKHIAMPEVRFISALMRRLVRRLDRLSLDITRLQARHKQYFSKLAWYLNPAEFNVTTWRFRNDADKECEVYKWYHGRFEHSEAVIRGMKERTGGDKWSKVTIEDDADDSDIEDTAEVFSRVC